MGLSLCSPSPLWPGSISSLHYYYLILSTICHLTGFTQTLRIPSQSTYYNSKKIPTIKKKTRFSSELERSLEGNLCLKTMSLRTSVWEWTTMLSVDASAMSLVHVTNCKIQCLQSLFSPPQISQCCRKGLQPVWIPILPTHFFWITKQFLSIHHLHTVEFCLLFPMLDGWHSSFLGS